MTLTARLLGTDLRKLPEKGQPAQLSECPEWGLQSGAPFDRRWVWSARKRPDGFDPTSHCAEAG